MKLWRVSRNDNAVGYDEFDSFIVVAATADDAKALHPRGDLVWRMMTPAEAHYAYEDEPCKAWLPPKPDGWNMPDRTWDNPEKVDVEIVGEALPEATAGTVVCASFNAG